MAEKAGQPAVILAAFWTTLVESLLGLGCCVTFFLFNRCVVSPSCPPEPVSWATGTAFAFYTSYVASADCNLTNGQPVFPTNKNGRTQEDDLFAYEVLYSVLYLAWTMSSYLLLKFRSGVWWASPWLLVTLVIVVFDLTAASIVLTDLSSEDIYTEVDVPGNCNLTADPGERKWSVVAMCLYLSRGGLVWLLNVVLLAWILRLAVEQAHKRRPPVNLDTLPFNEESSNSNTKPADNYWINRTFQDEDDEESEAGDHFAENRRHQAAAGSHYPPRRPAAAAEEPQYARPHIHLDLHHHMGQPEPHHHHRPPSAAAGVRRNSSLLERIRAAGNAPVVEGGLWSYGRLPGGGRLSQASVQPDKDVDTAFRFLSKYDTVTGTRSQDKGKPSSDDLDSNFHAHYQPFNIPRVRNMPSRKVSRNSSMLSNSDRDYISSPGAEAVHKRYFVPLKH